MCLTSWEARDEDVMVSCGWWEEGQHPSISAFNCSRAISMKATAFSVIVNFSGPISSSITVHKGKVFYGM